MTNSFDMMILASRNAFTAFQEMASRTDDALYQALGQVHELQFRIPIDTALAHCFDALLQQHTGGKCLNETLFLVKYAFFPHTLQPGPGHKSDITKASRYAKLINKARAHNIPPAEFVAFAREQGIQRTAVSSRLGKRSRLRAGPAGRRRSSRVSPITESGSFVGAVLHPLVTWFYSDKVGERLTVALRAAQYQPQKISLTVYVNHERAVVTGCIGQAWNGEFPEGFVRVPSSAPVQPKAAAPQPDSPRKPEGSRLPLGRRSPPLPRPLVHRGRQRRADGYVCQRGERLTDCPEEVGAALAHKHTGLFVWSSCRLKLIRIDAAGQHLFKMTYIERMIYA